MKKTAFYILVILVAFQTVGFSQKKEGRGEIKADTISADSLEYRLIILDPGFESWLATQPSKDFYSNDYYEIKNRLYITEWNLRYISGSRNGLYENYIDYKMDTNYGIDLNYKLYNYFKYFEKTNHVHLIPGDR